MKPEMSVLGIDIAKRVFHAVGMDNTGKIVFRKRLSRHDLRPFLAKLPPVRIGIEACGGAHYWARRLREHGHEVKLMAPQFVKPYVKSNKNDSRDAEAIAEAVTRPTMRFVPIKDVDQQDIQALYRVRERLMGERRSCTSTLRIIHMGPLALASGPPSHPLPRMPGLRRSAGRYRFMQPCRPKSRVAATRGNIDRTWRHVWVYASISVLTCDPLMTIRG